MNNLLALLRLDFLPKNIDLGLLLLRLWFGLAMLGLHGWGKLSNYAEMSKQFGDPIGLGSTPSLILTIFAEVVCSILIALGLFTRFAAVAGLITMVVAFFVVHKGALSGPTSGEMAFLYLGVYLVILVAGAGRFSLDAAMTRSKK